MASSAVASEGVIDILQSAGLKEPDTSSLSDLFLETVRDSPYLNLLLELLKKLLADGIQARMRRNDVQARQFSEMLEKALLAYQSRSMEAAQVILGLIELAKQVRDAPRRGAEFGLTEDGMAFYDALIAHGGVREIMGDQVLAEIAHELVESIRKSVTMDWTQKETVRAKMRARVRRLLRDYDYPPDKQAAAVVTVIDQAEQVCKEWGEAA